jgi:mannose-1-phosphate guanylyltransferase
MKIMVLAAGLGTRFQPHTNQTPKAALPFLNVPLAAFALQNILPIEPKELVVNTFHLPTAVENLFRVTLKSIGIPTSFSPENNFIRGSGGGLKLAESFFENEDHLILTNSDEVFLPKNPEFIQEAFAQHLSSGALSTLVTTSHPGVGTKFGGVWVNSANKVLGFGWQPLPGSIQAQHFIGYQILSRRIFKYLKDDCDFNILYDGLTSAFQAGEEASSFPVDGVWFETGSLGDYLDATQKTLQLLSQGTGPSAKFLKQLLVRWAPNSALHIGESKAVIWADSSASFTMDQVSGFAVLGPGSAIKPQVSVTESVVGPHLKISADLIRELRLNSN